MRHRMSMRTKALLRANHMFTGNRSIESYINTHSTHIHSLYIVLFNMAGLVWGEFECCMLYLAERVKSFEHPKWPHGSHYGKALADAGFYYLGEDDRCQCCKCGLMQYLWKPEVDIPILEHDRDSPKCEARFQQYVDEQFYKRKPTDRDAEFNQKQAVNEQEMADLELEFFKLEQSGETEKMLEVQEKLRQVRDRQNDMVIKELEQRYEAADDNMWDHVNELIKDCKEHVHFKDAAVPRCSMLKSSICPDQMKVWVDKLIEAGILNWYAAERVLLPTNTKADGMRIIIGCLERRLITDWVKAMKLKQEVMGSANTTIRDVVKGVIKTMTDYWAQVAFNEGRGHTVVQKVEPEVFLCLSEEQMREWFAKIYNVGQISGYDYNKLQRTETPKTTMAEMMSKVEALKYIKYVQLLHRLGSPAARVVANRLGQEQYFWKDPPPTPVQEKKPIFDSRAYPKYGPVGGLFAIPSTGKPEGGLFVNDTTDPKYKGNFGTKPEAGKGFGGFDTPVNIEPFGVIDKPEKGLGLAKSETGFGGFDTTTITSSKPDPIGTTYGGLNPQPVTLGGLQTEETGFKLGGVCRSPVKKENPATADNLLEKAAGLMKELSELMDRAKNNDSSELF